MHNAPCVSARDSLPLESPWLAHMLWQDMKARCTALSETIALVQATLSNSTLTYKVGMQSVPLASCAYPGSD
jgi:hypothetical protein